MRWTAEHLAHLSLTVVALGMVSCGASSDDPSLTFQKDAWLSVRLEPGALRDRFVVAGPRVLDEGTGFVEADGTFVPDKPPALTRRLRMRVRHLAEQGIDFDLPDGLAVHVRELGATGQGRRVSQALAFARAGGTSYWTVTANGYEEWLWIEKVVLDKPVAIWAIDGVTPRQTGEGVALDDAAGIARIHVSAPEAYTTNGERVSSWLVADGTSIALWVDAPGKEVLVDPAWTPAGPMGIMPTGHVFHGAAVLTNGKVLIAGGGTLGGMTSAAAELYDPGTDTWAVTGSMMMTRTALGLAALPNGRALAVGGSSGFGCLVDAEMYDSGAGIWDAVSPMPSGHCLPEVVTLQDQRVVVLGGIELFNASSALDIFDPATFTWMSGPPMSTGRIDPGTVRLDDGRVFVAGGAPASGAAPMQSVEIYDPVANAWIPAAPMIIARKGHTATLLADGRVLVAGGAPAEVSAEIYDPATDLWSMTATLNFGRGYATATLLSSGHVLVAGGANGGAATNIAELYDPAAATWTVTVPMLGNRMQHTASRIGNGSVLVAGGTTTGGELMANNALDTAEIFGGSNALGAACATGIDCQSGFCVDGVCCNAACNAGACDACSVAAGATMNGACTLLTGTPCSDSNACTQTDTCQMGVCAGTNPVVCPMPDGCHDPGVCNPLTGICSNPAKPDGVACNDANACTQGEVCMAGGCTGGMAVTCMPADACHDAGTCDPMVGCVAGPAKPDGTVCDDGNACSQVDVCQAGGCVGTMAVVCTPLDSCHDVGVCNPSNGQCSSPVKADGAACDDGNACSEGDTCLAGVCMAGMTMPCAPPDECHQPGACNPLNGVCSYPNKADGTACTGGTCLGGTCQSGGTGGNGGMGTGGASTGGMGGSGGTGGASTGGMGGSGGKGGASTGGMGGSGGMIGSSSGTAGSGGSDGGAAGTGGSIVGDGGGCGCRTATPSSPPNAFMAGVIALALAWRRRRSRKT